MISGEPAALGPTAVEADRDARRSFWLTHMRIGFGVFLAETLVVMAYLGLTPDGPHRLALWVVVGSWLVFALVGIWLAPAIASKSWRATYSVTWTVLSSLAVGVVAVLDHGADSPVLVLLFLPLAYAAFMFTPKASVLCGLAALGSAATVALLHGGLPASQARGFVFSAVIAGASVLSVAASLNRTRIEDHERRLLATIADLAATDELTGCAVRRVFRQRFEEEVARSMRSDGPLSLMMIDVDRFKSVNDTYGHVVGDHVLATIGAVLRSDARAFDLAGRLGGDEFALLLPNTYPTGAVVTAERIRADVASALEIPVTLSVGVSGIDRASPSVEQMFDDADLALYEVKRGGRDAISVRPPSPVSHGFTTD
jgi:diguanylate cyclase (GGDEF)-like protein